MKKIWAKKEYVFIIILIVVYLFVGAWSFQTVRQLRGNARVVNYVGIVRGATQKLVKEELMGYPDDELITRLDSIIHELITGEGPYGLVVLDDRMFMEDMEDVFEAWEKLKTEIQAVRGGEDPDQLYRLSQDYFLLVDDAVSSAERYAEQGLDQTVLSIWVLNSVFAVFLILLIANTIRAASMKRKVTELSELAYIDSLTHIGNRASCEQYFDLLMENLPHEDIGIFVFDVSSLKEINAHQGREKGDQILVDFARILKTEVGDGGFAGRYGGDEFVAVLIGVDMSNAQAFLTDINEKTVAYNLLHISDTERIGFETGYSVANLRDLSVRDMINEADKMLYERKKQSR